MNFRALQIFKTIVEQGSVSKAAKKLNCVQSNVTARLKQLEDEMDVKLFYRKRRGMVLTPKGKILLPYAEEAIRLLKEASRAVRNDDSIAGPLSIGTMESAAAVRLPDFLSAYHLNYPEVILQVSTGTTQELINKVLDYRLEGAFVAGPVDHTEIEEYSAFQENLVVITEFKVKNLSQLENPTFLTFRKGCSYRTVLETWAKENGIIPNAIMELGTLEGILGFIASGMGISLFPVSVVEKFKNDNSLRTHPIDDKYSHIPTVFIKRKDALMTTAMEAVIKAL